MTHPENIPSILFDWIELFSFSELSDSQKELVLHYLSIDEYNELNSNCQLLKQSTIELTNSVHLPNGILNAWNSKFETKKQIKQVDYKLVLWRIAASIVLFGLGWTISNFQSSKLGATEYTKTVIDTIFVESEVKPVMIKLVDTVYISSVPKQKSKVIIATKSPKVNPIHKKSHDLSEELDNSLNKQKRNSLKDDKFVGQFEISVL